MGKKRAGHPAKFLPEIARAVAAGQGCSALDLGTASAKPPKWKRMKKQLQAAETWHLENGIAYHASGKPVPGFAEWCGRVAIEMKDHTHRYRILAFYYDDTINYYAIPVTTADSLKELPRFELSSEEIRLLVEMADDLSRSESDEEVIEKIPHPAKSDCKAHCAAFNRLGNADERLLLSVLKSNQQILQMVTAAFDVSVHALKRLTNVPYTLYNFTPPTGDLQAFEFIFDVLGALNFTNASCQSAPATVWLKSADDVNDWFTHVDRMVILRTATGSLLQPLVKEIESRETIRKKGGLMPEPLPTVPISIAKGVLNRPEALDVELPKHGQQQLSRAELNTLRHAMARALLEIDISELKTEWASKLDSPAAYCENPAKLWWRLLLQRFLDINFTNPELREEAYRLLQSSEAELAEEQRKKTAKIQYVIERLMHPEEYRQQIIDRPVSKREAREKLESEAVAFRYIPNRGHDSGKRMLAFTSDSFERFLRQQSVNENLYEAVLDECEKSGILDNRNRSINLGGETFSAITFLVD